jgi:hypothetical protein
MIGSLAVWRSFPKPTLCFLFVDAKARSRCAGRQKAEPGFSQTSCRDLIIRSHIFLFRQPHLLSVPSHLYYPRKLTCKYVRRRVVQLLYLLLVSLDSACRTARRSECWKKLCRWTTPKGAETKVQCDWCKQQEVQDTRNTAEVIDQQP